MNDPIELGITSSFKKPLRYQKYEIINRKNLTEYDSQKEEQLSQEDIYEPKSSSKFQNFGQNLNDGSNGQPATDKASTFKVS